MGAGLGRREGRQPRKGLGTFTICFTDGDKKGGGGKKSGDTFGVLIEHVLAAGDPGPLPNSAPLRLKGGDITVH